MVEAQESLWSSYIANCVFNAFLCYTTIMLNIITIHTVRKTSSMPTPLKILLLSLAVSDLGVGFVVQPLYITRLLIQSTSNTAKSAVDKSTSIAFLTLAKFLSFASCFGVTALSIDRFLAVHLHLRYKELVTRKRVVAVVILTWIFSAFLSLMKLMGLKKKERFVVYTVTNILCLVTTALLYFKLYLVVKHHANQIKTPQVQQAGQSEQTSNALRLRKSALGTFYVFLVFLVCYLPQLCHYFATTIHGTNNTGRILPRYAFTMVFLNSSLNPLIYCWKMRHIRHALMNMLRKMLPSGN